MKKKAIITGLLIAIISFALDQLTKTMVLGDATLASHEAITVLPFFNLVLVWNYGVSFGMFAGQNQPLVLSAVSGIISLVLLIWLLRNDSMMLATGIGFVLGGAVGNIIDRLRFGAVCDFLDIYIGQLHWPAFNIADSCIFIGVVVLCVHSIFFENKKTL